MASPAASRVIPRRLAQPAQLGAQDDAQRGGTGGERFARRPGPPCDAHEIHDTGDAITRPAVMRR